MQGRSNRQTEAYNKVMEGLKYIDGSIEGERLLRFNEQFKENYARLMMCKNWYKTKRGVVEAGLPIPRFLLPHQHIASARSTSEDPLGIDPRELPEHDRIETPTQAEGGRWKGREIFNIPLLIEETPFRKSYLNLNASRNDMPLSVCKNLGLTMTKITPSLTKEYDNLAFPLVGMAKEVKVRFQGHDVEVDFAVVDTGWKRRNTVQFGLSFLIKTRASADMESGIVYFGFGCDCGVHQVWHDPAIMDDDRPFKPANSFFCKDLAQIERKQAIILGGFVGKIDKVKVGEILRSRKKRREPSPSLSAQAVPSHGKKWATRDFPSGTGTKKRKIREVISDSEEEESQTFNEHDPGDIHTTTPANAPVL